MFVRFLIFLSRVPVLLLIGHLYVGARLMTGGYADYMSYLIASWLVLSYGMQLLGFAARHKVGTAWGDIVSAVGFFSLGLFSWIFVLTLIRDLGLLVLYGAKQANLVASDLPLAISSLSVWWVLGLSVAAAIIGLYNASKAPAWRYVDIKVPTLPPDLDGFSIVQLTDLHIGPTIKKRFVNKVVKRANASGADVIALTGDLIDGSVPALYQHIQPLSELRAHYGVYGVTGNHEYYAGVQPWLEAFEDLGLQILLNTHVVLQAGGHKIILAGVSDYDAERFEKSHRSDPQAALKGAPDDAAVRILLAHQPRSMYLAEAAGFEVQISGHTHGGQFWPWAYFVPLQQPVVAGLHRHGRLQVYVSRGTGYWGPPLRLFAPSEITLIRIRSK